MNQLNWVTPAGTIANLYIGSSFFEELLAVNPSDPRDTITYQLVSGSLPPGLTLSSSGVLSGSPTTTDTYFTTLTYTFRVRASSSTPTLYQPAEQNFSVIITNIVNRDFNWITPAGDLGIVPNGEFYQLPLLVSETAADVTTTFSFISGQLPPGMEVTNSGYLQGVPTLLNSIAVDTSESFRFTVRAQNYLGHVRDQSFSLTVTNVYGPIIEPSTTSLGSVFDGTFFIKQLTVNEINPNVSITWSNIGPLPPGIGLSSNGLLSGYIQPIELVSKYGPGGYDGASDVDAEAVPVSSITPGVYYQITSVGTTDFTLIGSTTNVSGTIFHASNPIVTAANIRANLSYTILSVGTTNFTAIGSANNVVGTTFIANASGTGTGTVFQGNGTATEYNTLVQAGYLVPGITYQIQSLGTSNFAGNGAATNTVGTVFVANSAGYGTGYASQYISQNVITQQQEYDFGPYDFDELNQTLNYNFTIQAYDGANYDLQNYILGVVSRSGYTADNANVTVDNTNLTVDTSNVYIPVMLNGNVTTLPTGRAGGYYAYKFDGYDFQGDALNYSLPTTTATFDTYVPGIDAGFDYGSTDTNTTNPEDPSQHTAGVPFDSYVASSSNTGNLPGLTLDANTGWLYGKINNQSAALADYTFGVQVSKTRAGITYTSQPIYFTLPVTGDVNNIVQWITPSNLGTINNGAVSEIILEAKSVENKPITYSLLDHANVSIRLPQGLELSSSGEISGRVSFETFSLDNYTCTFDGATMTIDRVYNFTANVATLDGSASSTREFTLTLDVVDQEPYNNLYLRAMPQYDQRQIWESVVSNTEIFNPQLIYRPDDPWFGVAKNIEMLFLPGLRASDLNTYANAIMNNHYTKTYNFGPISTASVLDKNYNVKYEVVYINIVDPELNSSGNGPAEKIDLTNTIANPYIDANGNEFKIIYPNSSQNMIDRLVAGVGYYDQSTLPEWMTSNQPGSTAGTFNVPLGFTRAVVLAYTVPGASKLIAYRLNNAGINFNNIEFTVDRYLLDDFYTTNFNTSANVYYAGRETTFDSLPNNNIGTITATVDYAVTVPFDQINGRPLDYINANGGIDGVVGFETGDTVLFVKQENFLNPGPYEGWVDYTDAFIGDNITTGSDEGYDSEGYDLYSVVPGYLEKIQSSINVIATSPAGYPNYVQVSGAGSLQSGSVIRFSGVSVGGLSTYNTTGIVYYVRGITTSTTTETINGIPSTVTIYYISLSSTADLANPVTITSSPVGSQSNLTIYTVTNERGGIWQINILDGVVFLTFNTEIEINQKVRVAFGASYGSAILYYNPTIAEGQSVPEYTVYQYQKGASIAKRTTFNGDSTKFFSYRDSYYTPGSQDKYVKFPQYGAFN